MRCSLHKLTAYVAVLNEHQTSINIKLSLMSGLFYIVTEDEINHGILSLSSVSAENSSLCYARTLSNLEENLNDDSAERYVDVLQNVSPLSVDVEAQKLLRVLKHQKLPRALNFGSTSNYHSYSIPWVPCGVNEQISEHGDYLQQLCEQVWIDMKNLIDKAVKSRSILQSALHAEVLHHASLCVQKCETYCDRKDGVMTKVHHYINNATSRPLILHGKSGSGKTTVMAKAAKSIISCWSEQETFIILRFFGTSPSSSSIREALISICEQICGLYETTHPTFNDLDIVEIVQYFRTDLWINVAEFPSKTVILMLDSVDQLSSMDGAHSMKWLPLLVPSNVRIVVSMLNEKLKCFENTRSLLPESEKVYVELGSMHISAGV